MRTQLREKGKSRICRRVLFENMIYKSDQTRQSEIGRTYVKMLKREEEEGDQSIRTREGVIFSCGNNYPSVRTEYQKYSLGTPRPKPCPSTCAPLIASCNGTVTCPTPVCVQQHCYQQQQRLDKKFTERHLLLLLRQCTSMSYCIAASALPCLPHHQQHALRYIIT